MGGWLRGPTVPCLAGRDELGVRRAGVHTGQPYPGFIAVVRIVGLPKVVPTLVVGWVDRRAECVQAIGHIGSLDELVRKEPVVDVAPANGHTLLEVLTATGRLVRVETVRGDVEHGANWLAAPAVVVGVGDAE